ncbi:MAG: L,D-transpeptidase [Pseudomonadota bacterium]
MLEFIKNVQRLSIPLLILGFGLSHSMPNAIAFDQNDWLNDFSKVQGKVLNASYAPSGYYQRRPNGQNTLVAKINLSTQKMAVYINDSLWHEWKVSSGIGRYRTPTGKYRPVRLHKQWYSRKYNNAPMPYSIFFHGGYAIHGTDHIRNLGRPASHGCIRLHPEHASLLFDKVKDFGIYKTKIVIVR